MRAQYLDPATSGYSGHAFYINWRLLETDGTNTAFNIYRKVGNGSAVKLNSTPIVQTTDWVDTNSPPANTDIVYSVRTVIDGREAHEEYAGEVVANSATSKNYRSFPVDGSVGKIGIGDLDGDGEYDFVIRTPRGSIDPADGLWEASGYTYKLRAYKSDGTPLWTYDLGWNIEAGIWYAPFIVYDFDGDGKAEVAAKTANPRTTKPNSKITSGPEYLSIIDGETGQITSSAQAAWPSRSGYGTDYNRYSRNQLGVAYLDGKTPFIVAARGTYTLMKVHAYEFADGVLTERKQWNSDDETMSGQWDGQGAHSMHCVDVDGDGRDEIVLGASVLDDDLTGLWTTGHDHPDHTYVGDLDPSEPGLEIYMGLEKRRENGLGITMRKAVNGELLWKIPGSPETFHIHDEGLVADINPNLPGAEGWSGEKEYPTRYFHSSTGDAISHNGLFWNNALTYYAAYWDADPQREVLVRNTLYKFPNSPVSVLYDEPFNGSAWLSQWSMTTTGGTIKKEIADNYGDDKGARFRLDGSGTWTASMPAGFAVSPEQRYRIIGLLRTGNATNFAMKVAAYNGSTLVDSDILDEAIPMSGSIAPPLRMTTTFTIPSGVNKITPVFTGNSGALVVHQLTIIRDDNVGRALDTVQGDQVAWADLDGDWREEIVTNYGGELRIYSTSIKATDRRVTLMHDPLYRSDVAHVAMGYAQVPTTSYSIADPVNLKKLAIAPVADAIVRGGSYSGDNFGDYHRIGPKNASGDSDRRAYLRFDMDDIPAGVDVVKATLRMRVVLRQNTPKNSLHLVTHEDEDWNEEGITWSEKPDYNAVPISTKSVPEVGQWIEFDVTDLVQSERQGDGLLSFALSSNSSSNSFYSSSEAANPPHLLIETAGSTSSSTLAHWRFENGAFLADSTGGHTLSAVGNPAPSSAALLSSGAGSDFSDPIPQTGAANGHAANFGVFQSGNFHVADSGGWMNPISDNGAFTVEGYVNIQSAPSAIMYIASQWRGQNGDRSFAVGVDASRKLMMIVSGNGSNSNLITSGLTLDVGDDYYVAASFDASNPSSGAKFYAKNLTENGSLQSDSKSHTLSGVHNSPWNVMIGTYDQHTANRRWKGLIDEVRISNSALPVNQLLISAP